MISDLADLADLIKDSAPPEMHLKAVEISFPRHMKEIKGYGGAGWAVTFYLYFPKDLVKGRGAAQSYEDKMATYLESLKLWPRSVVALPFVDSRDIDRTMLALVIVREKDWPGIAVAERLKGNLV
jgi:hypothetical protein